MSYTKKCPNCKKQQYYSRISNLNRSIKKNTFCRECNSKKAMSDSSKLKISNALKDKSKSEEHKIKLREKNILAWKKKTKKELDSFSKLQSQINKQKALDIDYINKCKHSAKLYWDSLTQEQREERYYKSQEGGAGYCQYFNVLNYRVFGKSEKRYIEFLIKNNLSLPNDQKRSGIMTSYGIYFPDFEYEDFFIEIKSAYTFEKLKNDVQLLKIKEVSQKIKPVKIIVEEKYNKFIDKTELI